MIVYSSITTRFGLSLGDLRFRIYKKYLLWNTQMEAMKEQTGMLFLCCLLFFERHFLKARLSNYGDSC